MSLDNNKNQKLNLIVGLGRSGFWAAKFLNSLGKNVIVIESQNNLVIQKLKIQLEKNGIKVFLNKPFEYEELSPWLKQAENIIISPSIGINHKTVINLKRQGFNVIGEINIGWKYLKHINWIGITGTNGKTTVTHLLSHILTKNNFFAPAAGNIGRPICEYAYHYHKGKKIDWIIAELSSYQLEIANTITPQIGIWTTFTPDHIERHKTIDNYFDIKNELLKNSKFRIYNFDDIGLNRSSEKLLDGIWVSSIGDQFNKEKCDYCIDRKGYVLEKGKRLFDSKLLKLKGDHNIQNLLLATAAARLIGLTGNQIKESLSSYIQLPHRLETIFNKNNFEIINDSKATNFDSSIAGINSLKDNLVIIAGGRIKNGDSSLWVETVNKRCKAIFLYGESAIELNSLLTLGNFKNDIFINQDLTTCVRQAINFLKKENLKILLFSPACSSFDQFKDYEDRGDFFKSLINSLV